MKTAFADVLDAAEKAYAMAIDEYQCSRKNKREYQGGMPKRKHGPWRIIERLRKKHTVVATIALSFPAARMITAAYDQGLLDRHNELNAEYIEGDTHDDPAPLEHAIEQRTGEPGGVSETVWPPGVAASLSEE